MVLFGGWMITNAGYYNVCDLKSGLCLHWSLEALIADLALMNEVNLIEWQSQLAVCQVQWPTISIVDSPDEVNFDSFVCFVLDRLMRHSSCIPSVHRVNDQLWWRLIHSAGNFGWTLTGFSLNYYPCRVCLVLYDYTILNRWFVDKPKGVW